MFEDEMTEQHTARTEAEYRRVTRQEVRDERAAIELAAARAAAGAAIARFRAVPQ